MSHPWNPTLSVVVYVIAGLVGYFKSALNPACSK